MKPRLILLVFCLAGNALLATVFLHHSAHSAQAANATAKISSPKTQAAAATHTTISIINTNVSEFDWSNLTAPDLAVYIARLRLFGTPEKEVRDIIFGVVEAIYRPKRAALRPPPKMDDGKFWERRRNFYGPDSQMTKDQREQMRVLRKEETDLIKSLLGNDVYDQIAKDSGNPDFADKYYAFIPKELREKVQEIDGKMNEEKQDIYAANEGFFDSGSQADLRKIEKKYHDQLAAILTPDQLMEWDLRHSDTANQLKNDLSAFDPTEDEFRELFKYKQAMEDLNPPRDPDDDAPQPTPDQRKAMQDQQKTLDDELAQTLGADRAKEYKLEQDYSYRNLIEAGTPKEDVFKLDDMKQQAQAAANKIRTDQTLTPDERTAALSAIRQETQSSMNDLLGDKMAKRYSNNGGWWLNNIAPPAPPPSSP